MSNQTPSPPAETAGDAKPDCAEIRQYFDQLSIGRNEAIQSNPIIHYEQAMRARTVLDMLAVQPGERVLDIGCGNARDMIKLVECGAKVVGVDISEGMVAGARQEFELHGIIGVDLQVGDATCLNFADSSFDKILCSEVIEHIPDAAKALREMCRLLKPSGRLVLSTPNSASWYGFERYVLWEKILRRSWSHPCDEWRSTAELESLVMENGLRISQLKSVCYIPGFLVTYFLLPSLLQSLLVGWIGHIERTLRRWFPKRGYTICILASRDQK
ncbi:methyltransferase domain-containing protein [Propionivibrio sp.]|uniref:class I SAM-dependent methyltransferase n=1 Tax=Propionivibrio sp. TaxID=2212460 RepID=UPI0025DC0831|nr:methyltransferase domain-containing protein [Propionivibrio sp.]MBK7354674.1 methyltransferase domain-containing protein [Propionivibrio sp.]